ncbi:MAG: hypothetical protein E7310_00735 [Clostridiales bacterium]|nr:hypothetical protein [Clostridiales bacterium]
MKKLLLTILIILLCVLAYFIMFNNFDVGILKIESIADIKNKSNELDEKVNEATKLTAQTYPKEKSTLDTSINKLKSTKQQYESKIASMPDSEILKYMQVDNYEKEFLWTTIGSYATKQNLDLELDIVDIKNNDYYNLEFTVVGRYSDISEFIFSIEDDDELAFKIENFKMKPYAISETTTVTTYVDGEEKPTVESTTNYPYDTVTEKEFQGKDEDDEENINLFNKANESKNTNQTTKNTNQTAKNNTENQTGTSTSIVYNPDRVKATFTVSKVNVNIK